MVSSLARLFSPLHLSIVFRYTYLLNSLFPTKVTHFLQTAKSVNILHYVHSIMCILSVSYATFMSLLAVNSRMALLGPFIPPLS